MTGFGDLGAPLSHGASLQATWPHGDVGVAHDHLRSLLERVGQAQARRALAATAQTDAVEMLERAAAAGTALELLMKAYLCGLSPAMLLDRGADADSVLHLTGNGHLSSGTYLDVRTISANAALLLLSRISGAPRLQRAVVERVLAVRNVALHMGVVSTADLEQSLRGLVTSADSLATSLGVTEEEFWGDELKDLAAELRQEVADALKLRVLERRASASQTLARLVTGLGDAARSVLLMHLSGSQRPQVDDWQFVQAQECPVCGQEGWLVGDVERGPLQSERIDWHDVAVWVERTGLATMFECPVCRLELYDEELAVAELPTSLRLDDDDDPYEAYEDPFDEDASRDR